MCTSLYFFFQAEDGIRDVAVTGVQTCALPISAAGRTASWRRAQVDIRRGRRALRTVFQSTTPRDRSLHPRNSSRRSEERRVGKEWICRGTGEIEKTKGAVGGEEECEHNRLADG